jgi:hypothetical protein
MDCAENLVYRALKRMCSPAGALAAVLLAASPMMAQLPRVVSATINYSATPNQVTISGHDFGTTAPIVVLDTTTLTLISNDSTTIVANLPIGLVPGSYGLRVTPKNAIPALFVMTYGAVGPQGPAGATGATGAQGPAGATGATGAQGPAGATGATGAQGPAGATGAAGAQGPAGLQGPVGPQGPPGSSFSLPYAGTTADSSAAAFSVTNTAGAGANIVGGLGGDGIDVAGGTTTASSSMAGSGVNATGGAVGPGVYGGYGVLASGGTGEQGGFGVTAFGGDAVLGCGDLCTAGAGGVFSGGGGYATNGGDGVVAYAGGQGGTGVVGVACSGYSDAPNCQDAALFLGDVDVEGNLSKSGGSFKIDHPLDPGNKYLYHSFVESPDMKNIYDGNITTDGSGLATVTLPEWFEALNSDFRYQLTVIGQFAHAIVASEMNNNAFVIRTDKPNVKVSWQVTGIRQDAWAKAHRIPVEVEKLQADQGHYLHPELFGHAGEPSIGASHYPRPKKPVQQ